MLVQSNKHAGKHMSKKIFLYQYVVMEKGGGVLGKAQN
jgi:hypothetical protein